MDEELLLKIKGAEANAKSIAEDAEKKKQEMLRQATAEAVSAEEKEISDCKKQLDAEAKKEERKIEEERNALLAEGKKETEKARKLGEKNFQKAVDFVSKSFDGMVKKKVVNYSNTTK